MDRIIHNAYQVMIQGACFHAGTAWTESWSSGMNELGIDLMVANEAIHEAEEAFDQLRKDYHALQEHTDQLESILREYEIPFPEFWRW